MYGLRRFGIKLGLDTIGNMLRKLNNPHTAFNSIHVAGTNGKGSIASSLASILYNSGFKTGLYTSPHLIKFNERICINNMHISDQDVVEALNAVKVCITADDREPTFFEYTTAMALYEFAKAAVDWAVIETGMGGRLDATNIVTPAISIISNISIEHTTYLGNTIAEIASEKAGIIKRGIPVVTGVKQPEAIAEIEKAAAEKKAPLYRLGKDFNVTQNDTPTFDYIGMSHTFKKMRTGLLGNYQIENTALVLAACELLMANCPNLTRDTITTGIVQNKWPGRLEIVSESPYVILDGAHNLDAVRNLAQFLADHLHDKNLTLVLGILDDKPYTEMLDILLPICRKLIITQPKIDRSLMPEKIYDIAKESVSDVAIIPDVAQAVTHAIKNANEAEAICIAGSLYVVGEAKEMLDRTKIID